MSHKLLLPLLGGSLVLTDFDRWQPSSGIVVVPKVSVSSVIFSSTRACIIQLSMLMEILYTQLHLVPPWPDHNIGLSVGGGTHLCLSFVFPLVWEIIFLYVWGCCRLGHPVSPCESGKRKKPGWIIVMRQVPSIWMGTMSRSFSHNQKPPLGPAISLNLWS